TLIGLSLIKVGIIACGGGYTAMSNGSFGSFQNLQLAGLVLVCIVICNQSSNKYLRMSSIVIGLVVGYVVAWFSGLVDFNSISGYGAFHFPTPFRYGLDFSWSAFIALGLIYIITSIEAYGDITANSQITGLNVQGKDFMKRAQGGILADGFNSMLAGMINSFPNSIFAQNNGLILLTGIASRRVGYYIATMLVLLGLFPYVGLVFSLMPEPVLGGATLLMFGTVAAAGIRILVSQEIDRKASLVIAISLALGIGVEMVPDILCQMPQSIKEIFSSGITTGSCAAILSNMLIRIKKDKQS
ncbi:MAG: purine/pyrimidine permease, partial [Akkermansia sp.]|nr:purine/pyrimidine permease [Akkermansia sp.]